MTFTKAQRIKGLKKQLANLGEEVGEDEPNGAADDEMEVSLEGMGGAW